MFARSHRGGLTKNFVGRRGVGALRASPGRTLRIRETQRQLLREHPMFDALYVGATGMRSQQTQIDTIAHNLANINTTAFRRSITSFAEVSASVSLAEPATAASRSAGVHGAG